MIDLVSPSLQSMIIGYGVLEGSVSDSCSLIMQSNNEMIRNE